MRLQELLSIQTVQSLREPRKRIAQTDGHLYIGEALKKGAVAVASQQEPPPDPAVSWIQTEEVRPFMASLAAHFYQHPSRQLQLAGITGTNGKTTTTFLIHSILECQGPSLLMGTIKTQVGEWQGESERTTPEAVDIQEILAQAVQSGCRTGVLEVSSHALYFHRVYRCSFPVAVFTNLSQDHLDFHGSLEEYFQVKCRLFQTAYNPGLKYAVLNGDDSQVVRIQLPPEVQSVTFGFSESSNVYPVAHKTSIEGIEADLQFFNRRLSLVSPLAGQHNLYNRDALKKWTWTSLFQSSWITHTRPMLWKMC
jgi:UDP-N-acetylmuramoyl-L-alanyl-D-glutamate--2,6-diaminopimelate ligase